MILFLPFILLSYCLFYLFLFLLLLCRFFLFFFPSFLYCYALSLFHAFLISLFLILVALSCFLPVLSYLYPSCIGSFSFSLSLPMFSLHASLFSILLIFLSTASCPFLFFLYCSFLCFLIVFILLFFFLFLPHSFSSSFLLIGSSFILFYFALICFFLPSLVLLILFLLLAWFFSFYVFLVSLFYCCRNSFFFSVPSNVSVLYHIHVLLFPDFFVFCSSSSLFLPVIASLDLCCYSYILLLCLLYLFIFSPLSSLTSPVFRLFLSLLLLHTLSLTPFSCLSILSFLPDYFCLFFFPPF